MPKVDWGISVKDAQNFDREKQFAPYRGKVPPNAVYCFKVTSLVFAAGTGDKYPQLRIGLELVPQDRDEKAYKGYRLMTFRSVAPHTPFAYVPFLDAIGASEADFVNKTIADREGNVQRIGNWRNNGDTEILALLRDTEDQKGNARKDVGWIGPVDDLDSEGDDEPDDEDEYADDDTADDEDDYDDEEEEEEEEEEPAPRRQSSRMRSGRAGTTGRGKRR